MPSLMIIGTAHVIDLSYPLEGFIREFNPNSIALELDRDRWFALQSKTQTSGGPFFLRILARIQKYLGESFGSSPGAEMLVAANIARSLNAEINLIDKPILSTIRGASAAGAAGYLATTKSLGGGRPGKASGHIPTASHGFVPAGAAMAEVAGAYAAGYTPGQVRSTNIAGIGKVVYNTREKIQKVRILTRSD